MIKGYIKTVWRDATSPYINAFKLNKLESGVESSSGFSSADEIRNLQHPSISGIYKVRLNGNEQGDFFWDENSLDHEDGIGLPKSSGTVIKSRCNSGSGRWLRIIVDNRISIKFWGAKGDYDSVNETPGMIPKFATDNYPSLRAAQNKLELLGSGTLVIPADKYGGDYYFSNAAKFHQSNLHVDLQRGARWRCELPSSWGATVILGGANFKNISISGGGAIRNHLQEPAETDFWEPLTNYKTGDYVKNSRNHVYLCSSSGKSGTLEPSIVNKTFLDNTVTWRDAHNDNALAIGGENIRVENIVIEQASDKGITVQNPGSSKIYITNNIVYKTNHDGIEVKGNQGVVDLKYQEIIFVLNNTLVDIGRVGIEIEQPASGLKVNSNLIVKNNIIVSSGHRLGGGYAGIRINRCHDVVLTDNNVLWADGNGYHLRKCRNVSGDIKVKSCGKMGLHMQEVKGFYFTKVVIAENGSGFDAIRETDASGCCHYGNITVMSSGHEYSFREFSRAKGAIVKASSMSLSKGVKGTLHGNAPAVPAVSVSASNVSMIHSESRSVLVEDEYALFHIPAGGCMILSGVINCSADMLLEITIDGEKGLQISNVVGQGANNLLTILSVPPIIAHDSVLMRVYNKSNLSQIIGWSLHFTRST